MTTERKINDEDVKYMKGLLPNHYTCESRENGVHCESLKGIDDTDPEH